MSRSPNGPTTPRAWEHPDCPNCGTDVFVDKNVGTALETCHFCGEVAE